MPEPYCLVDLMALEVRSREACCLEIFVDTLCDPQYKHIFEASP